MMWYEKGGKHYMEAVSIVPHALLWQDEVWNGGPTSFRK